MLEPYLAEICIFSFNFAPKGWAQCNGQFMPINQSQALFALLGTTYGGNGQTTFALPDLRGRVAMHMGSSGNSDHVQGEKAGEESHTLIMNELPAHSHETMATTMSFKVGGTATTTDPKDAYFASTPALTTRFSKRPDTLTKPYVFNTLSRGGSQAHENRMPHLTLNYCIALQGVFPSQN